jgi:RNA polymerase sigma factor for flagellar operon FliA
VVLGLDAMMVDTDSDGDADLVLRSMVADTSLSPEEEHCERELGACLRDAVELLPERHRTVIQGYYFEARTSVELAAELGVTVSRISQIRTEAFEMLRQRLNAQYGEVSVDRLQAAA